VLDPGETTERIVAARLVQLDEAVDLAVSDRFVGFGVIGLDWQP
jgi:hypothetical protein